MEGHAQLDTPRRPTNAALIVLILLALALPSSLRAQAADCASVNRHRIQELHHAQSWEAIVRAIPSSCTGSADLALDRGLALARLGRLQEAAKTFRAGLGSHPRDARFLVELGGIAYREKCLPEAASYLRRAIAFDPHNTYAVNFLASIYFLEGNLDAALKYWNRVGKPKLNDLALHVPPGIDPLLLDRAFEFSRGSQWRQDQFLTTRLQLESLDLFPQMKFDLQAQPDGAFNLVFRASGRSRWGGKDLAGIASLLRGLPYQSIYPEFYNLNHKGLNWLSFVRWDDQKRRISSEVSSPLPGGPEKRFSVSIDARNENWDLTNSLAPKSPSPAGANMRVAVADAQIQSLPSWRWQWSLGGEYSYRTFRALRDIPLPADSFFTDTSALALRAEVSKPLVRFPERRFTLDSHAGAVAGKFFTRPLGRYGSIRGRLSANWLPQAQGDDYETKSTLRAGHIFGQAPLDDLFILGFDRDNSLWMRGHDALVNGQKGNAPMGRSFVLSNSSFAKVLYRNPFVELKLGPFLDTGKVYDSSGFFGSPKWLSDTGLQATVEVLGSFQFVIGYGRDLRSGKGNLYTTVLR